MTTRFVVACLVAGLWVGSTARAQDLPQRIMLHLTDRPSSSMAVTWRTLLAHAHAWVELAEATDGTAFTKHTWRLPGQTQSHVLDNNRVVFQHSTSIEGLRPGTVYAYRVGHDSAWSEWCQFTTARDTVAPFTFVHFGDPQDDIRVHVSRVFRNAFENAPAARFWMFTGDLTSEPKDDLWEEWFTAAGWIPSGLPSIMVPGNHDHAIRLVNGKKERTDHLPLWRSQFVLPQNGPEGLEETCYSIDYQGVRFVMLNSSTKLKEQAAWLDSVLASNRRRWTIAAFHHPFYSTGRSRDGRETRNAFLKIFDTHGVDLVLQGHDHSYGRTRPLKNNAVVQQGGTVYVVSSSGPKAYVLQPLYREVMATMAEGLQLYQVISIHCDTLWFQARTATGRVFDSFVLRK